MRENESHHFSSSSSSGGNVVVLAYSYAPLTTFWQGLLLDFQREREQWLLLVYILSAFFGALQQQSAAVTYTTQERNRLPAALPLRSAPFLPLHPSTWWLSMFLTLCLFLAFFFFFVSPWAIQLSYDFLLKAFFFLSFSSSSSHPFLSGRIDWPVNKKNR